MNYLSGIESAFKNYIGDESINSLRESITDKPMILIAGAQLTGKSTQAKKLAEHFGGEFYSVGSLFRLAAKERGITVAEQARLLLVERGIDVEIDYKTCQMISGSITNSSMGVIEGRQPAYMGSFMASLGKKNIIRLYFQCSILEQALRFLRREIGEDFYQIGRESIPKRNYKDLKSLRDEIQKLDIKDKNNTIDKFIENQNRDKDDRHRYLELYGFDYGNLDGYDIIIDTNDKEPEVVLDIVIKKLKDFDFRTN